MSDLPIDRILTISMAHVTPETMQAIEAGESVGVVCYDNEYGAFVYVPMPPHDMVPDDLAAVLTFAGHHDCAWVKLDRDGEEIKELPTYDW